MMFLHICLYIMDVLFRGLVGVLISNMPLNALQFWMEDRWVESGSVPFLGRWVASLSLDSFKVDAHCDGARLQRALAKRQRLLARCYQRALEQRSESFVGQLMLDWTIGADGRVLWVDHVCSTLNEPGVEACVEAQLKHVPFDGVVEDGAQRCSTRYQMIFDARPYTIFSHVLTRHKTSSAHLVLELLSTDGGCGEGHVRQRTDAKVNAWRYCYEKELRTKPTLAGEVTLGWTIEPDGATRQPVVTSTTLRDPAVESCLVRVAERIRFQPPCQRLSDVPPAECRVEMKMTFSPLKP